MILSVAFDTVDHRILLERLQRTFGVTGRVLDWVSSCLSGRTQFVRYNDATSVDVVKAVLCGGPRSSVLGRVLFLSYATDAVLLVKA